MFIMAYQLVERGGAFLEVIQLTECKLDMYSSALMYAHISYMHLLSFFFISDPVQ
jgi:hypothetical protein